MAGKLIVTMPARKLLIRLTPVIVVMMIAVVPFDSTLEFVGATSTSCSAGVVFLLWSSETVTSSIVVVADILLNLYNVTHALSVYCTVARA